MQRLYDGGGLIQVEQTVDWPSEAVEPHELIELTGRVGLEDPVVPGRVPDLVQDPFLT